MHPMMQLLINNRKKGSFRAEHQTGSEEATLYIYDVIVADEFEAEYWGGVAPESFIKELNSIEAPVIHLRLNSPGGSVFAARSMEQALREHPAKIIAHVDGYAASAASFLAMAADEVVMNQGGFIMIHKANTIAYGNTDDLISAASLLEKIDGSLVVTYQNRTGQDAEQIKQWMSDETWFSAAESVELGFADRIDEGTKVDNRAWDLSAYQNAPEPAAKELETKVDAPLTRESVIDLINEVNKQREEQPANDPAATDNLAQMKRQLALAAAC